MDDPIMIDAHDIRFSYDGPGGRRSLNGAQLYAAPGEFVAVLGHNGCGKSTLVKHFNALLPLRVRVWERGSLCTTADVLVREAQLPPLRVGDVIALGRCGAYSVTEGVSEELKAFATTSGPETFVMVPLNFILPFLKGYRSQPLARRPP